MTALDDLGILVMDAAAPIPSLQALLGTDDVDPHMPAIKELVGIIDGRLCQIADAIERLKAAERG